MSTIEMKRRSRTWLQRGLALICAVPALAFGAAACETYDSPPIVFLVDLVDGNLPDAAEPLVIEFSEPVDPATLRVKVVLLETDDEGNLFDEDESKSSELQTFFVHEPKKKADVGGTGKLSKDGLRYAITLDEPLPVGPALALLVEEGLADEAGTAWAVRQRISFGYRFACQEGVTSEVFLPGAYFFVVDATSPIPTQLQLWVWFDIDPVTGIVTGQFTNADRKTGSLCSTPCPPEDEPLAKACRTLPSTECVAPSFKAASEDEYVDFIPNLEPPEGYTFRANACVADQADGSVSFGNAPVDVAIEQPPVTVKGTRLTAQFTLGSDGVLRCNGSFTGDEVLLGTSPSGPASGTFTGRAVPAEEVPADIPKPE